MRFSTHPVDAIANSTDKQHGLESNLFLPSSEGEPADAPETNAPVGSDSDPDLLRLLHDRPA